jgi:RNA polymerase sigma-70 factor, ECF subfamily
MGEPRGLRGTSAAPEDPEPTPSSTALAAGSQVLARRIIERGQKSRDHRLAGLGTHPDDPIGHHSDSVPPPGPPDATEFLTLFHEYERYVASIGSRILGSNGGVDDLVQDVFLVIYQEFHKLRELTSIKAWLATIATRLAWRQRGRPWLYSKLSLSQVEELNPIESSDASPELQADLSTLLERLRGMPQTLRDPWLLRFIDGETLPRIAELCDCSQSTVQRRLREAGEVMLGEKLSG